MRSGAYGGALLLLATPANGGRPPDDWFSPEPREVRIGRSVYSILRSYLVRLPGSTVGKTPVIVIVLRALRPRLEPLRSDNVQQW